MGRHSAPGDEDEAVAAAPVDEDVEGRGRHARPEDIEQTGPLATLQDDQPTERIGLVEALLDEHTPDDVAPDDVAVSAPAEAPPKPSQEKKPRAHSTAADLALLRSRPDVRARCIAAVVVPFVLYVGAMLVVGAGHVQYLEWLWIPLILGLALAGNFLDLAYKRQAATKADEIGDEADRPA